MYYKLVDKKPVPCDLLEWVALMEDQKGRTIAQTRIKTSFISTVFLGMDHGYVGSGIPILFETMIFTEGQSDDYQERYCTYEEAVQGHIKACLSIDPDFKLMEFPDVDLVKIYEEAKKKYSKTLEKLKD